MLVAGHGRSQREDLVGVCVHQEEVFVRRGFLLAAVVLLVLGSLGGPLATACRAVAGQSRGALWRQGAGGHPACRTLRRQPESGSGPWQDGPHMMKPGVGLGLAQLEWSAMQSLQRMGCLKDEDQKPCICHLWQGPSGPTTGTPPARRALLGLFWRRPQSIGSGKRREQIRKFCVRQSGRREKLSWSVL